MKTQYIKSLLVVAVATFTFSCGEDFLEETPTQYVSISDVGETGEIYPGILAGTLSGLFNSMYTTGTGGTTDHADFGQKGNDIYSDFLSGDLALTANGYNRYSSFAPLLVTVDNTYTRANYSAWRYYYRIIGSANKIIDALGGNDATITDSNKTTMGQAKAMRAYAYFYLTQLYIPEYTPTSKVLPLYINTDGDALEQSETQVVYAQMIDDLEQAATLLEGYSRAELFEVNEDVANTLLAYVYGSMDTNATDILARDLAEKVIANSGLPITTKAETIGGFNSVETPSWLWGADITTDTGLDLISWWGQMDIYTYSYQWAGDKKAIDQGLYDQIKDTDQRKIQFATQADIDDEVNQLQDSDILIPFKKFYNAARVRGGQRVIEDDYIYMRIDELYMLSAEMNAKIGAEEDAKTRLKQILAERFDSAADYAYVDTLTGQALIDEIYLQTRIEFFAEGKSLLALKRNKANVVRGTNHLYLAGEVIPYNDDRLTLEIPLLEVQNNPFIN
ncbi:RagB/SusD family nutrient uptake outer membrane protein [Algibacter lectus]|uniref:SusD-like starch-binding protein associating with outer membrane n=3 Tax=Algibacter lectus TaxID=221126 RepID=A0A4R8M7P0_9FLAO|nr:RagB/SusD family nutrient uptake outer membrane protein [Algibacter lectus]MWW26379.1 RagB/SusD family nutrient uptake outer membrane protein [Algibacter lectus]TDY60037.1 SusD-like starch-binding protein associating with outer membrane [Algibacter lectus]